MASDGLEPLIDREGHTLFMSSRDQFVELHQRVTTESPGEFYTQNL